MFKSEPVTGLSTLIKADVCDTEKLNALIVKRYKQIFEDCPEKFLSIIQFELMPTPTKPQFYSIIENNTLIKFDERDLDKECNYTTPKSITIIAARAFENCKNIKKLTVSEGVIKIQNLAFSACTNLETIQLPSTVNSLGAAAFFACKKLNTIEIPEQVTTLEFLLFCRCVNLKTVTFHNKINKIDKNAFYLCNNVTPINLPKKFKSDWEKGNYKQDASYSAVQVANSILKRQGEKPLDIFR